MWSILLTFAHASTADQQWEADAQRKIYKAWGSCVDGLVGVPLPAPVYTTVAEAEVNADGSPASVRILTPSGSPELDACTVRAVQGSGSFNPPPTVSAAGTAHIPDIVLTLRNAIAPPPVPVDGPLVDAVRDPAATAAAVAKAPVRIASLADGRALWCGGSGAAPMCSVRDARGYMLAPSVLVCNSGGDLSFGTSLGPMRVKQAADLLPGLPSCPQ